MALPPVGSQLLVFSKKYSINRDTDLILDCLKNAGYAAVEGGAADAHAYRKKLDERGLVYGGSHVTPKNLLDVRPLAAYLNVVGGNDVCNSGLLTWDQRSLADWQQTIALLNKAGRELKNEGIHLHYHNHDFEFHVVEGTNKTGMDLLFETLDFSCVDLCMDVAWIWRGGDDPAGFLRRHKDKIGYLHFKDFDGQNWCELGRGKVNFASVMEALPEMAKVRWVMVEQDSTKMEPCDSAAISRRYLKDNFGY